MSNTNRESTETPTFLRTAWCKKNLDVTGAQASAIHDAFVTRDQLLDALQDGEKLTQYEGIGEKTASALWRWFKEDYGETVDPDGVLVLDDEGLHLPEWLVGYVGVFTVETPNITMRPRTTEHGLSAVSETLKAYPREGTWNERLSEGQIALSTPRHAERIYEIDDQRSQSEDEVDA